MTAMLESKKFLRMARSLYEEAMRKGLTPINPVKVKVLGSTVQGPLVAPVKNAIVSFVTPVINPDEIEIWVNPMGLIVAKSNPVDGTWNKVYELTDLFSSDSSGQGTSSSYTGRSVADIAELKDIDTTSTPDRTLVYVENDRMLYGFDLQATDAESIPTIVTPNVGPGAWFVLNNAGGGPIGNIDGGAF